MRSRRAKGAAYEELAGAFGIHWKTVYRICVGLARRKAGGPLEEMPLRETERYRRDHPIRCELCHSLVVSTRPCPVCQHRWGLLVWQLTGEAALPARRRRLVKARRRMVEPAAANVEEPLPLVPVWRSLAEFMAGKHALPCRSRRPPPWRLLKCFLDRALLPGTNEVGEGDSERSPASRAKRGYPRSHKHDRKHKQRSQYRGAGEYRRLR